MKNTRRIISVLILVLSALMPEAHLYAQELRVERVLQLTTDLSASVESRSDNNGRPCALVKVAFAQAGAEFEGNVIGSVDYKAGEYLVYMSEGTKFLKLKHSGYAPLMIRFAESKVAGPSSSVLTYDLVGPLVSKATYVVRIGGVVRTASGPKEQKVTFKIVTPVDVTLMVDQTEYPVTNGVAEIFLPLGDHYYSAFAPGYKAEGNKFMVYENTPAKFTIALEPRSSQSGTATSGCNNTLQTNTFDNQSRADVSSQISGMVVYDTPEEIIEEETIPFQLVEEKPKFNGGDANEFTKWVNSQLQYPDVAKENGVQGRVMLQFTVNTNGRVSNVKVVRGVDPSLDKEAVRVVSMSPKWTPGKQRDRKVKVTYTFPVIFQLK